ncbi:3'-5' exoribonuclease YhaM [Clostridia bacterium]|nr:3'-5' exoribonuclease YhaM [Clostridia bacterium]
MRLDEINLQKQIGNTIEISGIIVDIEIKESTRGAYSVITLVAGTSKAKLKWWKRSFTADEVSRSKGSCVRCTVKVDEYNGSPSLIITSWTKETELTADDLLPCDRDSENTKIRWQALMYGFRDTDGFLATFTRFVFKNCFEYFMRQPAAISVHHNFRGGLLLHTVEVTELALGLAGACRERLDMDLVRAGALLHDIGKLEEFSIDVVTGEIKYTVKGSLLSHFVLGNDYLRDTYLEFALDYRNLTTAELEQFLLLRHIVLSHHGKLEMGAVVTPATLEAKYVHLADMASCDAYRTTVNTQNIEDGSVNAVWEFGSMGNYYKRVGGK